MAKTAITIYLKKAIENGFDFVKRRFDSLKQLNKNFQAQRNWIFEKLEKKADYKRRLSKVLEVIKLHSCKYLGISYLTENSLCAAYEKQFKESISKRSINTYIKHLKMLQFISVIPTKREDGKQSANIVVMEVLKEAAENSKEKASLPFVGANEQPQNVAHKEEGNLHTKKTTSSCKTTDKDLKERKAKDRRLLNFIPKWFKEQIACCASEPRAVYEYWKVASHLAKRVFARSIGKEEMPVVIQGAVREFYQFAKAAEKGKFHMRRPFGFFRAVVEAEANAHARRKKRDSGSAFCNWLES